MGKVSIHVDVRERSQTHFASHNPQAQLSTENTPVADFTSFENSVRDMTTAEYAEYESVESALHSLESSRALWRGRANVLGKMRARPVSE